MNAIEITNLRKEYENFTLGELTLSLPEGCVMGLIGENGAGKSTLIKTLLNLVRPDGGRAEVLGCDIFSEEYFRKKQQIGVVLDDAGFPPAITVRKLNRMMRKIYENWDETLYFSYVRQFSLPEKTPFSKYSKGMKMKLSIAAALSHGARLLIFDEATSGLDPVVRDEILEIINDFTRDEKNSVLLSSHIISDLEKACDYIAFLHKGKLLLCEEKDVLLEKYGLLRCSEEELQTLPEEAVAGIRKLSYGYEVLVLRDKISGGLEVSPAGIEEIFLYAVKDKT